MDDFKTPMRYDREYDPGNMIQKPDDGDYLRWDDHESIVADLKTSHAEEIANMQDSLDQSIRREVSLKLTSTNLKATHAEDVDFLKRANVDIGDALQSSVDENNAIRERHAEETKQARREAYDDALAVATSFVPRAPMHYNWHLLIKALREKAGKL